MKIEPAPDSPPFVVGVAARLKRSAANPKLARRIEKMKGVLALRSSGDPQAVTVRFNKGDIRLESGVANDAGLVITLTEPKPKVKGALKSIRFALAAAKVLEPPTGTWQEEAARFWAFAADTPRMPKSMLIVNSDDGTELRLGDPSGAAEFELHGTGEELTSILSGNAIIAEELLAGKITAVTSLEHASVVTGRSIAWVMGEGR